MNYNCKFEIVKIVYYYFLNKINNFIILITQIYSIKNILHRFILYHFFFTNIFFLVFFCEMLENY